MRKGDEGCQNATKTQITNASQLTFVMNYDKRRPNSLSMKIMCILSFCLGTQRGTKGHARKITEIKVPAEPPATGAHALPPVVA